jgi:signal transduction histidine kinase
LKRVISSQADLSERNSLALGALDTDAATGQVFTERIGGVPYSSLSSPIKNLSGHTVGYMMISIPLQNLNVLLDRNTFYVASYLMTILILVTLAGMWFNRTFIRPMNTISVVAEQVAEGDVLVRVNARSGNKEMAHTIFNFNQMLDQLHEKESLRKTFISTLTHDLRTPLIAQKRVIDFLKANESTHLESQSLSLLDGLDSSHRHLLEMINQLLETFQYESGKMKLTPQQVKLQMLARQCLEQLQPIAAEKRIEMENRIDGDLDVTVDPWHFKRVLINLIGNSL